MNGTKTPRRFRVWHGGGVLAVLGVLSIFVGALQTTESGITGCPSGTVLVAKFEYQGGGYRLTEGTSGVVTIAGTADADGGSWSSTRPIWTVVVKGGTNSVIISYDPPATNGTFSNAALPPVGSGEPPDISNVQFCAGSTPPTTTTTTTPATSTTSTTSTTTPATTTTTTPASTTSTTSTTTTPATTTTTTPASTTSTTTPGGTTTTTTPATTTTTPATTTTTPATTTTTTEVDSGAGTTTTTTEVDSGAGTTTTTTVAVDQRPPSTSTTVVGDTSGPLPNTGAPSALLVTIGAILTVAGITLVVVDRARRNPST